MFGEIFMKNSENNIFLQNDEVRRNYNRFSKRELLEQKRELIFYIIRKLTSYDMSSIQESIQEIKELTGIELTMDEIIQIKCLNALPTDDTEQEKKKR